MAKVLFTCVGGEDAELLTHMRLLLPGSLQEKILEQKGEADRLRSIAGYLLIRRMFVNEAKPFAEPLTRLEISGRGKPFVAGGSHFNLSHSGALVVAAMAQTAIGVDIEKIDAIDVNLYQDYFSDAEWETIISAPDPLNRFFQLWTRKEAVIKAADLGTTRDLRLFDALRDEICIEGTILYIRELAIRRGYACNVAMTGSPAELSVSFISVQDLHAKHAP
jgi:4'-phosphopantetheinyl transferase